MSLMRRVRIVFAKSAFHLLQLGYKVRFCVHPAGGIAQKKVDLPSCSRLICFVAERGRISIVLSADHFNAESFGPNTKLFNSCSAKSVGRRQQDAMSILLKITSEFRRRCCLSSAVYTKEQNYLWFGGQRPDRSRIARDNTSNFLAHDSYDIIYAH